MPTYLIRLTENKELVGICAAISADELFWLVDECTDPNSCEYKILGTGGIFWMDQIDMKIPVNDGLSDIEEGKLFSLARMSEDWDDEIFNEEGKWFPVPT